jgi:eukaryotic-like serine/threonine-protein kinase
MTARPGDPEDDPPPVEAGADAAGADGQEDDKTQFAALTPPADAEDRTRIALPLGGQDPPSAAVAGAADPVAPPVAPPPPLPLPRSAVIGAAVVPVTVGTHINNNYEVTQVLKSGGMGEVYRGFEIGTGDPVAIKAILPELAEDEKASLLFKREARTLRQLSDEAIVRYYNYVHDRALNRYFLVMEFIEGVPLSDVIQKSGAITPAAGRTLLARLAKGLAKAHAQNVIHRDLSPDNVMLPDGLVAEARLIDFGIAKSGVVKEGTMAGQFAGKLKYVAPEQLGHYNGDIGPATDVYGLALLLCAAVIGRPLDMGASIVEAVQSRTRVPDLSAVPAELRPILSCMLEPDPANRPASMEEVQRLLERPDLIPAQYRGGLPLPPAMAATQRGGTLSAGFQKTAGLQPAPGLQVPGMPGPGTPGPRASATLRGATVPELPPDPEESDKTGSRVLIVLAAGFVALLGWAGWYGWSEGLIGGGTAPRTADATVPNAMPRGSLPPVQITSREGFLATFDTGACTYAARVASGAYAGMVEGFATGGTPFETLPAAYEAAFGARPAVQPRQVTPAQCAALDLARALQGRSAAPVQMLSSTDRLTSGETFQASVSAPEDAALWTVLISPEGAVFNLTERLSDPQGGQRTLSFGLNLTQGSEPVPHLLLSVASESPLVHGAAMRDGSAASEILPAVLEELGSRSRDASAALGWILLSPAPVPAPDADAGAAPVGD